MPQGDKWHSLLTVNENKTGLIHCFVEYLKAAASNTDCTIVSKDTGVFLLLIYAFYK